MFQGTYKKVLLCLMLLVCGWKCHDVLYYLHLAKGQAGILFHSVSVESMLGEEGLPDSLKKKLKLLQEIKRFAEDELGLVHTENYNTYYEQQGRPLLWVVTGSGRYDLQPYHWTYAVMGSLAYKGFFEPEAARQEAGLLASQGYDTAVDKVSAWSTLGWFPDPVLSGMLKKDAGSLARLVIHELAHSTIYYKGDAEKSENLATLIGDRGAALFLKRLYGDTSEAVMRYAHFLSDIKRYSAHMNRGARLLDSLYGTFDSKAPDKGKDALKKALIGRIMSSLDTIPFYFPGRFPLAHAGVNNAFFTGYKMYRSDLPCLEETLKQRFHDDLGAFISYLRKGNGSPCG